MAARTQPSGSVPVKDVKQAVQSSKTDQATQEEIKVSEATTSKEEVELDEKDLEEIGEKKIPYARFKEVNEKAKTYEQQLKEVQLRYQEDIRRAQEDAEIRASQRYQRAKEEESLLETLDPAERNTRVLKEELDAVRKELSSLKGETKHQALSHHIERLEQKYPKADSTAVLAIAKHLGKSSFEDIEDLMVENHSKNIERAEQTVREILEAKKQRAKAAAIPTKEGGIRLKESDRPKTLKEASAKLKALFGG